MSQLKTKYTTIIFCAALVLMAALGMSGPGNNHIGESTMTALEKCNSQERGRMQVSCEVFVNQYCKGLMQNSAMSEKVLVTLEDVGLRVPSLKRKNDAYYPVDCYRQWWLTGSVLALHEREIKPFNEFTGFSEQSPEYFAHEDSQGNLQFPARYRIEQKYSQHDQELLKRALHAAYKYADVNVAIEDGYVSGTLFDDSMGIHFTNFGLLDETVDIDHPEFLTYIKSRDNNAYALAQIGYIQTNKEKFKHYSYPLFETGEAHGHNHFLVCLKAEQGNRMTGMMVDREPYDVEIEHFHTPEGKRVVDWTTAKEYILNEGKVVGWEIPEHRHHEPVGNRDTAQCHDSAWMLHVAVNLYNEEGLFADMFPLINTMTSTGEIYSFFGRKFNLDDYTSATWIQKISGLISSL